MPTLSSCPELRILLADVKAQPEDDTPRLILGDWLQDQGDPRGEFIHLQVVLRRLAADDPRQDELYQRERRLLHQNALDWLGPLADPSSGWVFLRGFIGLLARAERFLVPEVFDLASSGDAFAWVEELILADLRASQARELARSSLLSHLVRLDLSSSMGLRDAGLEQILRGPDLGTLHTLHLDGCAIGERGATALARCAKLMNLRVLGLRRNRLGDTGALALAESPHLTGLSRLEVSSGGLSFETLAALREAFGQCLVVC
jgi:uncharacterized protein (TIGR02996 family)